MIDAGRLAYEPVGNASFLGKCLFSGVEEARAARSPEPLAASTAGKVATDCPDIDGHLSDGLAGVQQVNRPESAGESADLSCGLNDGGVGLDMGQCDEHTPAALVRCQRSGQPSDVDQTVAAHRQYLHGAPGAPGRLEEGHRVAGILAFKTQDAIVGVEVERVESLCPSSLRRLHEGNLTGLATQQVCQGIMGIAPPLLSPLCLCCVPADGTLELQVSHHGFMCSMVCRASPCCIHVGPASCVCAPAPI